MKTIVIFGYFLALMFAEWCGKPFQKFFKLCAGNSYASILLFGFLVLGIIRLIRYFAGELDVPLSNPFRGVSQRIKPRKKGN